MTFHKLARVEINLLKHLVLHAPFGAPIIVPEKFRLAFAPLWGAGLINVWYRQERGQSALRRNQFVSLTVDGHRRIDAVMSNTPEFESRRLAGPQGRSKESHD